MNPPTSIEAADVLLVESTYGDRRHPADSIKAGLTEALNRVANTRGVLLVPAFAVGRTQQVLYHIRKLQEARLAPEVPVYIDSPMAVDASHLKCRLPDARNAVLFVGYQAKGTRGRALLEGAKSLRIHGQDVPVRAEAARIASLSGPAA